MDEKLWKCPECGRTLPRFEGESNITCPKCGIFLEAVIKDEKKTKILEKLED